MNKHYYIIFAIILLINSKLSAQQKTKNFSFNINSRGYIRILDGVLIDDNKVIKGGLRNIYRISDTSELRKISLPIEQKPYMILNSEVEDYSQFSYLIDDTLRKFQVPFVVSGNLISYSRAFKMINQKKIKPKYLKQLSVNNKKTPFGILLLEE